MTAEFSVQKFASYVYLQARARFFRTTSIEIFGTVQLWLHGKSIFFSTTTDIETPIFYGAMKVNSMSWLSESHPHLNDIRFGTFGSVNESLNFMH